MNKKFWILILVVVVGVVLFSTCKRQESKEESIKIGTIYQLTGVGAEWGEQAVQGIKLAVEEINNSGGVHGIPIEVIYEDSQSKVAEAVNVMNRLVKIEQCKVVLSQQSSIVVALSPIANNNQVILVDTGATTPAYISPDDFTFRVSYSAPHFAKKISRLLNENNIKSMGLLYVNNDYGLGMLKSYQEYFDGEIVAEVFQEADIDFRTQIKKIKILNPEAIVYTISGPKQAGVVLKQIKEIGLTQPVFTDIYSIEYPVVLEVAGEAAEDVIYTAQEYDTQRQDKIFKDFNKRFLEKYGQDSNPLSAQAYDGLTLLAYIVGQCEDYNNTECIKNKLFTVSNFQSVVGAITFDRNGEVVDRSTTLKTVKGGKFVDYGN